jgi:hypothetical protein
MKHFLLLFTICTALTFTSCAQAQDEKDVATAFETLKKGMLDGDKKLLESVAAPELSYGHSSGKVEDKTAFIESLTTGKSDFVTLETPDVSIKVVGTTALVRHKLTGKTNDSGVPGTVSLGVLLVFQKQAGAWKLLARQAYKL